jgi:flagellar motor switch/type III secretory pathway protein FliN
MSIDPKSLGSPAKTYSDFVSENWTVKMLQQKAKNEGLSGIYSKNKAELLKTLRSLPEKQQQSPKKERQTSPLKQSPLEQSPPLTSSVSPLSSLSSLPVDVVAEVALKMDIKTLSNLCKTNTSYRNICNNDFFLATKIRI